MAEVTPDTLIGADSTEINAYQMNLLRSVAASIRAANRIPKGGDYNFHATSADFRSKLDGSKDQIHSLIAGLLRKIDGSFGWGPSESKFIEDDERAEAVSEATDVLLERVDLSLDQSVQEEHGSNTTKIEAKTFKSPKAPGGQVSFMHARNIKRPQLSFPDAVDNSVTSPFVPKIVTKPNAKVPLDITPIPLNGESEKLSSHMENLGIDIDMTKSPSVAYPHPYKHELDVYEPTESQLCQTEIVDPLPVDKTPLTWVETSEALNAMAKLLESVDEIAIDLEAHSYRTYSSFACLLQISTRTEDFLVDAIALRGSLHILNGSFTNPDIIKVLHGADHDVLWLQKDLGLYLVNLFDTGQATRVLEYPRFSLAYLLKKFCDIDANKQYQIADWRIRPLPDEMTHYAREDTHSLLFIYDKLRTELIERGNHQSNLLRAVWMRSRDVCLQKYEKPLYSAALSRKLLEKHNRSMSGKQLNVFNALHAWRDKTAREEDESTQYVLPNHMLFQLADTCPVQLPMVIACCQKGHRKSSGVPPLVRINAHIIVDTIKKAIESTTASLQSEKQLIPANSVPQEEHSTATSSVVFEPFKRPEVDAQSLQLPSNMVSKFAQIISEPQSGADGSGRSAGEDMAKAADVQSSFRSKRLFGPPLRIDSLPRTVDSEKSKLNVNVKKRRLEENEKVENNEHLVLSKLPRTKFIKSKRSK